MIVFSVILLLLIAVVAAPPTVMLRKRQRMTWWDYVYPFAGIAAWFPLGMSNVGATVSLSNFVAEVFWIAVVSVAIPWTRWVLPRFQRENLKALPLVLTFLPIIVAVVIRLTMPTLPE
jgi:hypothetical protein